MPNSRARASGPDLKSPLRQRNCALRRSGTCVAFRACVQDKRILIVAADELVRWGVARELSAERLTVESVADGAKARACIGARSYDLMVLDVDLPDEDGVRLTAELHAARPETEMIVLSGDASSRTKRRVFDAGALQCLDKPFEIRRLVNLSLSAVGRIIERRRVPRYVCSLALAMAMHDSTAEMAALDLSNVPGETTDVGAAGLGLRSDFELRPGQRLTVRLLCDACPCAALVPKDGHDAAVVWSLDDDERTAGLRFTRNATPDRTS